MTPIGTTFLWGLKRSGIHLLAGWLYANLGATTRAPLAEAGQHPQLSDGFHDPQAAVAYVNNCGRFSSRRFELGELTSRDFVDAAGRQATTIFGIEDCALRFAARTWGLPDARHLLLLRDPLNNIASRLEAGRTRPEQFRVDEEYVELLASYCDEWLGHTAVLPHRSVISYNRFVRDRSYRDALATELGVPNLDEVTEVSSYGGGSSFSGDQPSTTEALMRRFEQHPVPPAVVALLLARPAIVEVCRQEFGYDLATVAGGG